MGSSCNGSSSGAVKKKQLVKVRKRDDVFRPVKFDVKLSALKKYDRMGEVTLTFHFCSFRRLVLLQEEQPLDVPLRAMEKMGESDSYFLADDA
ncbi:unnamed protein product [Gongylonema pulchrum]|uniref:Rad60-SLD domain-containing protein n=1 Tax=Gongylonema pulchrum TaxID=637853 RepID=A0A183DNS1_9BILA|nr:unnamed protein product [Gongylonema pulchrum]